MRLVLKELLFKTMDHDTSASYLSVLCNKTELQRKHKAKEDHANMAISIIDDALQQAFNCNILQLHQQEVPNKPGQHWFKYLKLSRLSLKQKHNYLSKKSRQRRHQTGKYKDAFANYSYRAKERQTLFNLLNTTHRKIITQTDKSECPQDDLWTFYVGSAAVEQQYLSDKCNWLGYTR